VYLAAMARKQLIWAVLLGGATVLTVVPLTGTADAATTTGSAYVWANDPTSGSYTPATGYQSNSTGATNTITHDAGVTGAYTVHLPNLGSASGTVLVTAYGSSHDRCKVASWGPVGTRQDVHVRCFTVSGAPDDTTFTMSYTNKVGAGNSFVWADQPNTAQYTPSSQYQANSAGGTGTVIRNSAGNYRVLLPTSDIGVLFHAQVTAYGTGPEYCGIQSLAWSGQPSPHRDVSVRCFAPSGAVADARFTLTTARAGNVLGQPVSFASDGYPTMYMLAAFPDSAESVDDDAGGTAFAGGGGTITKDFLGTGRYAVHGPVDLSNGDVQVTAFGGSGDQYCKVEGWTSTGGIRVDCFTGDGAPVDAQFEVAFVGAFVIA
jgi:hypothetical protein